MQLYGLVSPEWVKSDQSEYIHKVSSFSFLPLPLLLFCIYLIHEVDIDEETFAAMQADSSIMFGVFF